MLQKRNGFLMLILFAAACCLCGCAEPHSIADPIPTTGPAISEPATPTMVPTTQPECTSTPAPTGANAEAVTNPPAATSTPTPTPIATPTPTATPTPIPTVPPAPAALNTDTVNTYDFLVNREYPLTAAYAPTDLVIPDIKFSFSDKTLDKRKLRKVAADALTELCAAALAEDGLTIYGVSGYRSYDRQYEIYGTHIVTDITEGNTFRNTNLYSAAPGNSEHQSGLAMDVSCKSLGYGLDTLFATTPEGIWLKENCWRFGFILRYPKDKEHITGYAYEPWHIRYVGVPLAYHLYTTGLTLEEYYGSPSTYDINVLTTQPLIDLTTERFYNLYATVKGSELYYDADGSILVSSITNLPFVKETILDAEGNPIVINDVTLYMEPAYDSSGNIALDYEGNICFTKPYHDAEGNLWLDYNGLPVYLQPLWNANGTLATDADGNVLYTEPLTNPHGLEIITDTGSLIQKVPVRDEYGNLIYENGSVRFYEPFVNPVTQQFIIDTVSGEPLYPSAYYDVPHNTLPLPSEEPEVMPEPEYPFYEEDIPETDSTEEPDYDTTEETGGFFE